MQIEPYSPWSNQAEQSIQELKKNSAQKMIETGIPKRLWYDCNDFESYDIFNITNDHSDLKGQTPETFVSGETADISEFAKFGWYNWVMYHDTKVVYPDIKPQLGCYFGPAHDIGP